MIGDCLPSLLVCCVAYFRWAFLSRWRLDRCGRPRTQSGGRRRRARPDRCSVKKEGKYHISHLWWLNGLILRAHSFFPSKKFFKFDISLVPPRNVATSILCRPSLLRQFALIVSCLRAIAAAVVRSGISLSLSLSLAFFEHPKINFLA